MPSAPTRSSTPRSVRESPYDELAELTATARRDRLDEPGPRPRRRRRGGDRGVRRRLAARGRARGRGPRGRAGTAERRRRRARHGRRRARSSSTRTWTRSASPGWRAPFTPVVTGRPPARARCRRHEGLARRDHARRRRRGRGKACAATSSSPPSPTRRSAASARRHVVRRTTADAAIVTEPTEEVVAIAHKGFVAFEVETAGVAAHGSRPDLGIDAIAAMGPVLSRASPRSTTRLRAGRRPPAARHRLGPRLGDRGRPGVLELPGRAAGCQGERRTMPGETVERRARRARGARGRHGRDRRPPVPPRPVRERRPTRPSCGRCTGTWATTRSAASPSGPTPRCSPTPGSRPSSSGPVVGGIHGVDEWVDLASLERCYEAYLAVARELCG